MKFSIKTLGCKVNQYESQSIREQLLQLGIKESEQEFADIYIVNTCTVTQKADAQCRTLLRNCFRYNPQAEVIVAGCYVEKDQDEISQISPKIRIIKNDEKDKIGEIVNNGFRSPVLHQRQSGFLPLKISNFANHTKAFVKIQDGCDNYCTYCKVPYVRGRSRSRSISDTIEEISRLTAKGFKEIVLTGICLGSYGREFEKRLELSDLLNRVEKLRGNFRVRLSSIDPQDITHRLLEKLKGNSRFCRHLHIPLQSGDNYILKRMARKYTSTQYLTLVERIKNYIPDIAITTDVVVGFPGEDDENFENTVKVINVAKPSRLHVFSYSPRPGTAAYALDKKVDNDKIKNRSSRLRDIGKNLSSEYKSLFIGKSLKVLVETKKDVHTDKLQGYTDNYIKVLFDGPEELKNTLTDITITGVDEYVKGELSQ